MSFTKLFLASLLLVCGCVGKTDIKKEIADYHVCIIKCDEIENNNTFNFYKCCLDCTDLFERKKDLLNTLDKSVHDKGMVEITEYRNQCVDQCQQKVIAVRAEIRDQIKRCKEICLYNLKK